jgi:hypothetical protein
MRLDGELRAEREIEHTLLRFESFLWWLSAPIDSPDWPSDYDMMRACSDHFLAVSDSAVG